jgi:hypothetical protein
MQSSTSSKVTNWSSWVSRSQSPWGASRAAPRFYVPLSRYRNPNGQTQPERDWLFTVPQHDGSLIFMIFVAPQADFARFQPTYEAMVKSVQFP